MSRTISSNTTGPVVLGPADNPLTITSTGTVTATGSGANRTHKSDISNRAGRYSSCFGI
jgi:hypothetical protein